MEILCSVENIAGAVWCDRNIIAFRDCLVDCGLKVLGYRGCSFAWCRGNSPNTHVMERLDRFLAMDS